MPYTSKLNELLLLLLCLNGLCTRSMRCGNLEQLGRVKLHKYARFLSPAHLPLDPASPASHCMILHLR